MLLEYFEIRSSLSMRVPAEVSTKTPKELEVEHIIRANKALAYLKSRGIHLKYTVSHPDPFLLYTLTEDSIASQESSQFQTQEDPTSTREGPPGIPTSETVEPPPDPLVEHNTESCEPTNTSIVEAAEEVYEIPDPKTMPPYALTFERPYVVAQRSNLRVDGASFWDTVYTPPKDGTGRREAKTPASQIYGLTAFFVLSPLYGGLHLVAWSSLFPSNVELWMWRASGIVMVAIPAATALFTMSLNRRLPFVRRARRIKEERAEEKQSRKAGTGSVPKRSISERVARFMLLLSCRIVSEFEMLAGAILLMVISLGWLLYPFARLYVLGEAFAQLRYVEKDVYRTVEWSSFIPHVG
jgi:hypothetical protein